MYVLKQKTRQLWSDRTVFLENLNLLITHIAADKCTHCSRDGIEQILQLKQHGDVGLLHQVRRNLK